MLPHSQEEWLGVPQQDIVRKHYFISTYLVAVANRLARQARASNVKVDPAKQSWVAHYRESNQHAWKPLPLVYRDTNMLAAESLEKSSGCQLSSFSPISMIRKGTHLRLSHSKRCQ